MLPLLCSTNTVNDIIEETKHVVEVEGRQFQVDATDALEA